jgi:type IV secretion system coupling TraD/TrwB family protein
MPRSDSFSEPQASPLAPVEQVLDWLLGTASAAALGLAFGLLAARFMRSRGVHWSWGLAGLLGALPAARVLGVGLAGPGLAALAASAWARRWHREDLEAGRDLAELASARRSPLGVARAAVRWAALRRRARARADWFAGDELIIGRDEANRLSSIPLGGSAGGTHTLVLGATGSGKTMTQAWMAARAIERGMGAIVIDPKGDRTLRDTVRSAALARSRTFIEWSPDGRSVYNPYAHGTDTEIADKALAGERFTEPHYLRQAQRYLGHAVRTLRLAGEEVSLQSLVEALDPASLERIARTLPEHKASATHAYLDSLTPRQQRDLAGVRDRLAILAESDLGRWLDPRAGQAEPFDLLGAVRVRAVVYFTLDSDSRPLLTQMLGAAIVQDLQTTVAALQDRPAPTLVLIDEFSALSVEHVVRLFGRARSAAVSIVLGTQELADLRLPGRERMLEQVLGNLSAVVAHRQVLPDSCALVAGLAGTRGAWRTSRHSDGRSTRTRTSEGVLAPERLMRLGPGAAAVTVLTRAADARIVRVFSIAND